MIATKIGFFAFRVHFGHWSLINPDSWKGFPLMLQGESEAYE
jgi:hypothetical protein